MPLHQWCKGVVRGALVTGEHSRELKNMETKDSIIVWILKNDMANEDFVDERHTKGAGAMNVLRLLQHQMMNLRGQEELVQRHKK